MGSSVVPQQQHPVEMETNARNPCLGACFTCCPAYCYEFCGDVYKVAVHVWLGALEESIKEILSYFTHG